MTFGSIIIRRDRSFASARQASEAFTVRLLRLEQKIASCVPMTLKRMANVLNTDAILLQKVCDRFSKYGDETSALSDGRAVEIPVF